MTAFTHDGCTVAVDHQAKCVNFVVSGFIQTSKTFTPHDARRLGAALITAADVLDPPSPSENASRDVDPSEVDLEQLCACGHRLGVHSVQPPHRCLNGDDGQPGGAEGPECVCAMFAEECV